MAFFMFAVITAALALATFATLLVFETPIFAWLGYPFIALLELAQLPEAATAVTLPVVDEEETSETHMSAKLR